MAFRETPIPNTIIHNSPPPLVEVSGTHHEMGCQIGEARREQVQHSIENAHILIDQSYDSLELTWGGAKVQSRKYLPFAEERYPQYIEEMQGVAQGANVTFDDVVVLNVMEAMTMDALHLTRCTSFASGVTSSTGRRVTSRAAVWTRACWRSSARTCSPRMS